MFSRISKFMIVAVVALVAAISLTGCNGKPKENKQATQQAAKEKFRFGASIYSGWMPWYYAAETGILKKWADRYNIEIEFVPMGYGPSLDAFVAGKLDAVVMTNMEALDMPAASGIHTTAIIAGDYSDGNDVVATRNGLTLAQLKGREIWALDKSVSVYLLARGLQMRTNFGLKDVKVINVSDEEIAGNFLASRSQNVVVTWKPMALEIMDSDNRVADVFNSSSIPGEIQDWTVANTASLKRNPDFARALTGAWYETLALMQGANKEQVIARMAELSKPNAEANGSPEFFKRQLATTHMFWTPADAVTFTESRDIQEKMNLVRQFCFNYGLLGENAKSADVVGIQYPDGTVQGDRGNVKLVFDATFMKEAAQGKLRK